MAPKSGTLEAAGAEAGVSVTADGGGGSVAGAGGAVAEACEPAAASGAPRRAGRPRSEERHQAILDAALAALVEEGYDHMSIERVAARAGAGKATVYRRWPNKAELVVEAVAQHGAAEVALNDTGDLRADMRTFLRGLARKFNGIDGALMTAFVVERMRHPELQAEFDRMFTSSKRDHLRRLVSAAIARGDLPADTDVDLVADIGPALLWQQFTTRPGGVSQKLVDRILDQFFPPVPAKRRR